MTKVMVTESHLEDIADAIRAKNGSQATYKPGQMAAAISAIPTGGITPAGTINITQNGTVDVTNYASASVNVSGGVSAVSLNIRSQAFIGGNGTVVWTNTNYPDYKQFWLDLLPFQGKTVTITNTGDRNYYGYTSVMPYSGLELNAARVDSGGSLSVTYDGGPDRYLIYDFSTVIDGGLITVSID